MLVVVLLLWLVKVGHGNVDEDNKGSKHMQEKVRLQVVESFMYL